MDNYNPIIIIEENVTRIAGFIVKELTVFKKITYPVSY